MIATSHHAIRQSIRQQRRSLSHEQQTSAALALQERVIQHEKIKTAQHIALFLSFDGEIDTKPLMHALWQQGKQLYLPRVHPFSKGQLLFFHYTPTTTLIGKPNGLQQPALDLRNLCPLNALEVILTPLVAFDRFGQRLGMGGGYYDRVLSQWPTKTIYPIGLAHDCQYVAPLLTQAWDIPLPEIITPTQHWQFTL